MTNEQAEELGRRAIAAGWPEVPMPGELRRSSKNHHTHPACVRIKWGDERATHHHWPDFRDPATRGILLEQVREKWDSPLLTVAPIAPLWSGDPVSWHTLFPFAYEGQHPDAAPTEAGALVAALESACPT